MRRWFASPCPTAVYSVQATRRHHDQSSRTGAAPSTSRGEEPMKLARAAVIVAIAVAAAPLVTGINAIQPGKAPAAAAARGCGVDAFWPKPLPNHWVLGSTIGVSVERAIMSGYCTGQT